MNRPISVPTAAGGLSRIGALRSAVAALLLAVALAPTAHADVILLAPKTSTNVQGSESHTLFLTAPGAGTVNISLADLAWPTRLESLSFSANDGASVLKSALLTSAGTASVDTSFAVTGPTSFYAHLSGLAADYLGIPNFLGSYSTEISFTPFAAPVPLPQSVWLLLAGLGVLAAWRLKDGGLGRAASVSRLPAH